MEARSKVKRRVVRGVISTLYPLSCRTLLGLGCRFRSGVWGLGSKVRGR